MRKVGLMLLYAETKFLCIFIQRNLKNIHKDKQKQHVFSRFIVRNPFWTLLLHSKKLSSDYWIGITDKRCVKISVWDFCGGSVKVSTLGSTVTLLLQWGPPAEELPGRTSSPELSREAFWQADLMQSLSWELSFFCKRKKERGGGRGERKCRTWADTQQWLGWGVSITNVKLNHTRRDRYEKISFLWDLACPCRPVLHLWKEVRNWAITKLVTHYKTGCTKIRQQRVYSSSCHIIHRIQPNGALTPVSTSLKCAPCCTVFSPPPVRCF